METRPDDQLAVLRLNGQADLQMATRYVQNVSKQTDKVIETAELLSFS